MLLQANDHVLFYGDSITDAGRNREMSSDLGLGYAFLCAAQLAARFPEMNLKFTNTGISGNRAVDLEGRLQSDVLDLKPTLVSILIGVNDTWRRYDSGSITPTAEFQESYRRIARGVQASGARLLVLEPFVLPVPDDRRAWREDLDPRITACREIAREFGAPYVPLDGIFAAAACRQSLAYWLPDGVHPSPAGHALIAQHWIDTVTL